jgi:hypothetical protein
MDDAIRLHDIGNRYHGLVAMTVNYPPLAFAILGKGQVGGA